jgi:hypothetical protein
MWKSSEGGIMKIRAWDKKLNVMWEGIELTTLLRYLLFQHMPNATAYEAIKDHFDDIVWLEFTGLLDKNGTEIYEGDIVQEVGVPGPAVVDKIWWDEDRWRRGNWEPAGLEATEGLVVVGNIYANPELV